MKKLLTLISILALVFCMCACGNTQEEPVSNEATEVSYVGEWNYYGASTEILENADDYLTADIQEDTSVSEVVTLNEDKTGTVVSEYGNLKGTWEEAESGIILTLENGREWKFEATSDGSMLIHPVEKTMEEEPDIISIYKKK